MAGEPVTLVEPQIIYRDERYTVWHAGVVRGPAGTIVLNVEIDSPGERRFRDDPAWQSGGPPPIDAYIQLSGVVGPVAGSFSLRRERFSFHFQERFLSVESERLPGAKLHIKIHPLDLHVVIDL